MNDRDLVRLQRAVRQTRVALREAEDAAQETGTNPYSTPKDIRVACDLESARRADWMDAVEALQDALQDAQEPIMDTSRQANNGEKGLVEMSDEPNPNEVRIKSWVVSPEFFDKLLADLDAPPNPNEALMQAMKDAREIIEIRDDGLYDWIIARENDGHPIPEGLTDLLSRPAPWEEEK